MDNKFLKIKEIIFNNHFKVSDNLLMNTMILKYLKIKVIKTLINNNCISKAMSTNQFRIMEFLTLCKAKIIINVYLTIRIMEINIDE